MQKQYAIVIDADRCINCRGGCQVACKAEHGVALGDSRSKMYSMGPTGTYPELELYFLPVMCQQCEEPACAGVCPTGACYKNSEDGVVMIDRERCIGCRSCLRACPYNALNFNNELHVMDKCDICAQRRETGEAPACVKNCSGRAILYGDRNDPDSAVSKALREVGAEHVHALPDPGNRPSGRFILRNAKWVDGYPQDYEKQLKEGYYWQRK